MRAYELEESAVEELKDRLPKLKLHNYDTIDRLMQHISIKHKITGKKLHDMFVSKYGHTPDTWVKKITNKLSEDDIAEGFNDDNFTIDDIHRLEQIKDFETLKARAKHLIKGKPARRMKPEKIAYFYNRVDTLTSPMKVIKMMYDLLLAGEGMRTIGSQNSTNPNLYQRRFTEEQGVAEGHADQQHKIFKKNGKPVGEVGIDAEASPGNGKWYMTCYGVVSYGGYDSYEEAVAELKHCLKQGVAEGIETVNGGKYNVDPSKYYVWAWDGAVVLYGEYDNIQDAKINLPKIEQRAIERLGPYAKDAFELSTGKDLLQRYGKKNVAEEWSKKYKSSINCSHPKGFSQKAHCAGKRKHNESVEMEDTCPDCGMCQTHGDHSHNNLEEACWKGYHKEGNKKMFGKTYPNCVKNTNEEQLDEKCWDSYKQVGMKNKGGKQVPNCVPKESIEEEKCPHCAGPMFSEMMMNEKKDACYYKVKSRYKVWPSAYASGALVKCRKSHGNWGDGGQKSESMTVEQLEESLHDWFTKEKWVRMDTKGNIKGPCAREPGEGKPKCLPQAKAHSLGKKGRASAAQRKRREDPNPDRHGAAINVNTKKKSNEGTEQPVTELTKQSAIKQYKDIQNYKPNFKTKPKSDTKEFLKITVDNPNQKKSKVSEGVEGPEDIQKIKDFIKWSYKTLNMQKPYPKITLSKNTEVAQAGHHTGVHKGNNIWVYVGNRNMIDIFRTIFHELTHHRQMQLNMIKDGDSYPGSPIEMLADMAAGKYIKVYGKDHPEMFQ